MAEHVSLNSAVNVDFSAKAGQAGSWPITITDDAGAVNISGWQFKGDLKENEGDTAAIASIVGTVTNGAAGEATLSMTLAGVNAAAAYPALLYDLWYLPTGATAWLCMCEGTFSFEPVITNL